MTFIKIFLLIILVGIAYLYTPKFGALPKGKSLERIQKSSHYKLGKFRNLEPTRQMTGDISPLSIMSDYFFGSHPDTKPKHPVPAVKTDLNNLTADKNVLIWFGHSSYFAQLHGKKFLFDPVFSKTASPVPFNVVAFDGTDIYKPEDMPQIDYLIITHDHWDHLDYPTIKKLKPTIGKVITGLGNGAHFRRWGFDEAKIIELDWNEKFSAENLEIYCLPARHFSGRGLTADKSLWASYLIKSDDYKLYAGGDSGYGLHYKEIGDKFGQIDIALLDSGQYDKNWKYIHEQPHQVIQAARDLNTKNLLPVHNSKFTISNHLWYEPLEILSGFEDKENFQILTPKIGEPVNIDSAKYRFDKWWKSIM